MGAIAAPFSRIWGILFRTEVEWERVDAEPASGWGSLAVYAVCLSLVPALAPLVQRLAFAHAPPASAVALAALTFGAALLGAAALSGVIAHFAGSNGGEPNRLRATRLAVYSNTPGWLASLIFVLPIPGFLVLIANLYGLYILGLGLARVMRTPRETAFNYLMTVLLACFMINIVSTWALAVAGNLLLADAPGALEHR